MRTAAKVDELALPVQRYRFVIGDRGDDFGFVFLADAAEKVDGLLPVPNFANDRLVAIDDLAHAFFDDREIVLGEGLFAGEVVVEAVLDRGADGHLRFGPELLDGFGEDVRRIVPQEFEPVIRVASYDLDCGIGFDIAGQVP